MGGFLSFTRFTSCGHNGSNLLSSHTRGLRTQTQLGLVSSLPFPGLQGAAGRYETSQHDDWYLSKVGKSVLILNPVFPHSADLLSKGTTVWKPRLSYLPYTLVCFTVEGVSSGNDSVYCHKLSMDFRCSRLRGPLPGLELQGMSRVVWEVFSLSHVSPLVVTTDQTC